MGTRREERGDVGGRGLARTEQMRGARQIRCARGDGTRRWAAPCKRTRTASNGLAPTKTANNVCLLSRDAQ
eukprot:9426883-Lingulodinium_polyedra.AAC.1